MKPLNYKERSNKFYNFITAAIITLLLTICCFYYTQDFLTDAISSKRIEEYSRFQQYRRNQQQYVKYLQQIKNSLLF